MPQASDNPGESPEQTAPRHAPRGNGPDPSVSGLSLAKNQIASLVQNMTSSVAHELTDLRDEIDQTIRDYRTHEEKLLDLVERHFQTGESARAVKTISTDAMKALQTRLEDEGSALAKLIKGDTP